MNKKLGTIIVAISFIHAGIFALATGTAEGSGRVLQTGMGGEDVRQVQAQLSRLGHNPGVNDGIYGDLTKSAVRAFQQAERLSADGVVGQETLSALRGATEPEPSRGSAPQHYKQVHNIVATAYAPGKEDNGRWGDMTHLGTRVRPGVIAVDPKLIPLGSRVYIQLADGQGMYAVAEDTGGAIKENRIDIAFANRTEAKNFGIQNVRVFVIE